MIPLGFLEKKRTGANATKLRFYSFSDFALLRLIVCNVLEK